MHAKCGRENRQKALHERYGPYTVQIGNTNCTWPERGQLFWIPHRLLESERQYRQGRTPDPANKPVLRIVRPSTHGFDIESQLWVLASQNPRPEPGLIDLHVALRTVKIFNSAVQCSNSRCALYCQLQRCSLRSGTQTMSPFPEGV